MNTVLAIVAAGLGTYFSRASFILVMANRQIPPNVLLALQYVAPSVLGALIMTMLLGPEGDTTVGLAEIAALAVAGAVAWKTKPAIYTLIAGMLVYWLVGAV